MVKSARLVLCLALLSLIVSAPCVALDYQVTALSPLSGYNSSMACDINDTGVVAGTSLVDSMAIYATPSKACTWDSTGVHELAPLPGYSYGGAYGINNSGVVVGYSTNSDLTVGRACYWDSTGVHDLGASFASGITSSASAIDEQGRIVVNTNLSGGYPGGSYLWDGATMNPLSAQGWQVVDCLATNNGVTVGRAWPASGGNISGLYWDETGFHPLDALQAGYKSEAYDVNGQGVIVGSSYDSILYRYACLWNADGVHGLAAVQGDFAAVANGINDRGLVVGASYVNDRLIDSRGVYWDSGAPQLLPALPNYSSWASAVNENDWIIGSHGNGIGLSRTIMACLWTPVPEPSALAALAVGLMGIMATARRRR